MSPRAGAGLLGALAPVVFLAVDPAGWFPFGPVKWLALTTLLVAGAALVLAGGMVRASPPLVLCSAGLVAAMALAAVVGLDPLYAWTGTPERHAGVILWALCALALLVGQTIGAPARAGSAGATTVDSRMPPGPVVLGVVVAGAGLGLAATAEALGWEPEVFDIGSRLTATLGSSAYLGAVAALLVPVVLGVASDDKVPRAWRAASVVAAAGLFVAVVGSGARAAWVGLGAAGVITVVARRRTVLAHPRRAALVGAATAVAVGLVLVLTPAGDRLGSLSDPGAPGGAGRLDEWRVAGRVLVDHPVTGVGPEGYRIAFGGEVDERYEQRHGRDPLPDRAHSGPLDVALAGGPLGLAAWVAVLGLIGRSLLRALRGGRPWMAGLAAGLVAHWVGQLVLFPLAELEPVAWLLAGVVVAGEARPAEVRSFAVPRPAVALLGGLAVVAVVAGGLDVAADRRAETAATLLGRGPTSAPAAERAAEDAVRLRPDVIRYRLLLATARTSAGRGTVRALDEVDQALDLSPDDPVLVRTRVEYLVERAAATQVPAHARRAWRAAVDLTERDPNRSAAWRLRGRAAVLIGSTDRAEAALERGAHLAPRDPDPLVDLALVLLDDGRTAEAESVLRRAARIAPTDPTVVAATRAIRGSP
jgi:O-antigen ligase/Flp pilus assembly protein TadD